MDKHSSFSSYFTGFLTTFVGGLTLEKFTMIVGIATSIGTFAINWYYKRLEAKRRGD